MTFKSLKKIGILEYLAVIAGKAYFVVKILNEGLN